MKNLFKKSLLVIMAGAMVCTTSCNTVKSDNQNKSANTAENTNPAEKTEDTVLTIGVLDFVVDRNNIFQKAVDEFNRADNGYKIEFKSFSDGFYREDINSSYTMEQREQMEFLLIQDLINHDEIDIIMSISFINPTKYESLKRKGAFVDLYKFMETDSEVTKSALNETFLKLSENEGKLYSLSPFFTVQTLIGEEQYVGTEEGWTFADFVAGWEKMPDNATIANANTADNVYYNVLRSNDQYFIDNQNAQVHFDSPEFKEMLEFCNSFPYYPEKDNQQMSYDYDYYSPVYVDDLSISGIMDSTYFDDNYREDNSAKACNYTFVGYPSEDGNGAYIMPWGDTFSICTSATDEEQKGAWEFIRTFLTEEWQAGNAVQVQEYTENGETLRNISGENGLCVNNKAFDRVAEAIINGEYFDGKGSRQGTEYTYDLPTWDNVNELKRYIGTINRLETDIDRPLFNIMTEEVLSYFAGEKSLDEAVDNIQNRTSIWVSEQA